jgi:hypothetical protein
MHRVTLIGDRPVGPDCVCGYDDVVAVSSDPTTE